MYWIIFLHMNFISLIPFEYTDIRYGSEKECRQVLNSLDISTQSGTSDGLCILIKE